MSTLTCWDAEGRPIEVPDIELTLARDLELCALVPCRGFAHSLAVVDDRGRCKGWVLTETIGFANVQAFLAEHAAGDGP